MISANMIAARIAAFGSGLFSVSVCLVFLATTVAAQSPASPSEPAAAQASSSGQPQATPPVRKERKTASPQPQVLEQRSIFFPDLAHDAKPLTPGGKFKLAVVNSVSPAAFLGSAFGAGIAQATNSPEGYGQGAEGYGKRFGSSMATGASTNLLGTFLLASIAHHDPRFFIASDGSFGQSVKFGLRRVLVTRTDAKKEAFNWDGLLAPLMASALANVYQPEAERTVGKTFSRYGYSIATTAGINVLKEFWPTITRKILVPIGMGSN